MPWVTPVHAVPQRVIIGTARVPVGVMVHNVVPHERMPLDTRLARWVLSRATQAVAHTSSVANDLRSIAPGVPVTVTPHPPNLTVVRTPLPPLPPMRLLWMCFVLG
jgi:hypothetical protein